jgi:hypothetical protein
MDALTWGLIGLVAVWALSLSGLAMAAFRSRREDRAAMAARRPAEVVQLRGQTRLPS